MEILDLQLGTLEWGSRTLSILIYFFTTIVTFKTLEYFSVSFLAS